jgi:hypothetical protein
MENNSSQNPIEKIDFLIEKLVDFSNENEFDFALYQSFAHANSKTFNRYFAQIDSETDKAKIISDLKTNFHFEIKGIVTEMLSTKDNRQYPRDGETYYIAPPIPDTRISNYESNYKQLIELFLNSVEFETKPQTNPAPENLHPTMFINDSFKLFEYILANHVTLNRGRINDISFYYWKMYNDKFIIQKPFPFQDWFSENYSEVIGKIQTLESVSNPDRLKHYSTSLNWYKTVKQ